MPLSATYLLNMATTAAIVAVVVGWLHTSAGFPTDTAVVAYFPTCQPDEAPMPELSGVLVDLLIFLAKMLACVFISVAASILLVGRGSFTSPFNPHDA